MFEALGIVEVIDKATKQDPEMRIVRPAVPSKRWSLNGLGFVNQQLSLVPHFFNISRPLDSSHPCYESEPSQQRTHRTPPRYALRRWRDSHSTASLLLPPLAVGLAPTFTHLDRTSLHVDGRYQQSTKNPRSQVMHVTQGYSRDHRPDLNQVSST